MKQLVMSFACIIGFVLPCSSCRINVLKGEGAKGTDNPTVSSFNAIELDIPVKAFITVQDGAHPGVQISGYENILKHLKTKVENGKLIFYSDLDETWEIDYDGITVQVTAPSLKALSLSGAPDAEIHGNITGSSFKLTISGASKVAIDNINVDNFSSEVSGSGNIDLKRGYVKSATHEISGAGKIKAFPLQTDETVISISGSGKGLVTANQKLSVSVSGAGSVKYKGHPSITQDISGAGSVAAVN